MIESNFLTLGEEEVISRWHLVIAYALIILVT